MLSTIKLFNKRAAGIEPASLAWKAKVLPLNYARIIFQPHYYITVVKKNQVIQNFNFNALGYLHV